MIRATYYVNNEVVAHGETVILDLTPDNVLVEGGRTKRRTKK